MPLFVYILLGVIVTAAISYAISRLSSGHPRSGMTATALAVLIVAGAILEYEKDTSTSTAASPRPQETTSQQLYTPAPESSSPPPSATSPSFPVTPTDQSTDTDSSPPADVITQSALPTTANLADLENLGAWNVGPQTVGLGGKQYVSSLVFSAERFKQTDSYDLADAGTFTRFEAVIGVPGDSPDYRNLPCDVTFTDQAGRTLYPTIQLSEASEPQAVQFSVAGVSKLQIVSIWESNDGTHYVHWALGTPTLS